jgi:hypothetical protein
VTATFPAEHCAICTERLGGRVVRARLAGRVAVLCAACAEPILALTEHPPEPERCAGCGQRLVVDLIGRSVVATCSQRCAAQVRLRRHRTQRREQTRPTRPHRALSAALERAREIEDQSHARAAEAAAAMKRALAEGREPDRAAVADAVFAERAAETERAAAQLVLDQAKRERL